MNRAAARQRVARVDHQVEDDLLQVVRIDEDGALPSRSIVSWMSSRITRVSMSPRAAIVAPSSMRVTRGSCLRPNASSCRVSAAPRSVERRISRRGRSHQVVLALVEEDVGVAHRDLEQVVEIVRDARGELTDRFHLLRAAYLLLRRAYISSVARSSASLARRAAVALFRPSIRRLPTSAIAANTATETGFQGKPPLEGNASAVPAAASTIASSPARPLPPVGRHRHRGKYRRERREGEEWPGHARDRHAYQGHQDGEAIGFPEGTQYGVVSSSVACRRLCVTAQARTSSTAI